MANRATLRTLAVPATVPQQLGEYQLIERLGGGGMGTVWKAWHGRLKRVVAIKRLPSGRRDDRRAVGRFEREMEAIGRLSHPNIVQAYDAREIDGTTVLVMEYIDGMDLGSSSAGWDRSAWPMPANWSVRRPWDCNTSTSTAWCIATLSRRT